MIYDRTYQDVLDAKNIIETKVKTFAELTAADVAKLERGTVTVNTLNRIEAKQAELMSLLNGAGYYDCDIENATWTVSDIFDLENFQRLLSNAQKLINAYYVYDDTPSVPSAAYMYTVFNALEKILTDIETIYTEMTNDLPQCNALYCGERTGT